MNGPGRSQCTLEHDPEIHFSRRLSGRDEILRSSVKLLPLVFAEPFCEDSQFSEVSQNQNFITAHVFNEMRLAATLLLLGSERVRSYAGIGRKAWTRPPERVDVLKIQRSANGATVITLSGRMEKEHIVELGKLLDAEPPGRRIVLDLKALTLAGQSEIDFFVVSFR